MVEYLGTVNNIITTEQLSTLTGATSGTVLQSGDITWLLYNVDNTQILVANKLIKSTISYDLLNDLNLVEGKEITIGNATFICRLLSGGNSSSGGGEWDEFIVNFASEDEISNWKNYWTWCKETVGTGAVVRGSSSVSAWNTYTKSSSSTGIGWRPVLEVKIPPLANSIQSQNLGNKTSWSNLSYTITGDTHSLVEKLDGTIIRSLGNQASGTEYTLDLSQQWDSISYGKHTIEIIVTDSNGLSSIVEITFNKIKEITKPIPTTSSLKSFVDHIGNVDKDIDYLRYKLYDNLTAKGVECSDTDKMSSLVDKVNELGLVASSQSGVVDFSTSGYSKTIDISEVDLSKSICYSRRYLNGSLIASRVDTVCTFKSSTSIELTRKESYAMTGYKVYWEVIEFKSGVKSVFNKLLSWGSYHGIGTYTHNLGYENPNKCIAFYSYNTSAQASNPPSVSVFNLTSNSFDFSALSGGAYISNLNVFIVEFL